MITWIFLQSPYLFKGKCMGQGISFGSGEEDTKYVVIIIVISFLSDRTTNNKECTNNFASFFTIFLPTKVVVFLSFLACSYIFCCISYIMSTCFAKMSSPCFAKMSSLKRMTVGKTLTLNKSKQAF